MVEALKETTILFRGSKLSSKASIKKQLESKQRNPSFSNRRFLKAINRLWKLHQDHRAQDFKKVMSRKRDKRQSSKHLSSPPINLNHTRWLLETWTRNFLLVCKSYNSVRYLILKHLTWVLSSLIRLVACHASNPCSQPRLIHSLESWRHSSQRYQIVSLKLCRPCWPKGTTNSNASGN